jgi:hypothetical protein
MGAGVTPAGTAERAHLVKTRECDASSAEIGAPRSSNQNQNPENP